LGRVGFIEQRLALQIARLNVVTVNDANSAYAGAGQQGSQSGAGGPASDQGDVGTGQLALPRPADSGKQHLPRISFFLFQTDHPFQAF
jgi:hypothetical protein